MGETKIKTPIKLLLVLAVLVALSGCLTVGNEFRYDAIPQIKVGQSTMQDVEQIFGMPVRRGMEEGDRVWTFAHYKANILGDFEGRDLVIKFDGLNKVKSISYNSTNPDEAIR